MRIWLGKFLRACSTLGGFSETSCGTNTNDIDGHGSGVSGTAAAQTNNGTGVAGVCWGCSILPVKVLNDSGSGTDIDVIQGILFAKNYALNNPTKKVIINMSLGRNCEDPFPLDPAMQDAINLAWNAGVLLVSAAGNDASSLLQCPAAAANMIAVSATDNNDNLSDFSSFGSFVDLAAPGGNVSPLHIIFNVLGNTGNGYTGWIGTSFSSPIVAGLAGLVWSANMSLTNVEVDQILRDTADNIGSSFFFGDGRVNADQAVQDALGGAPQPPPPPPPGGGAVLANLDPGTTGNNTIQVTGAPAGAKVVFKYSFLEGRKVIPGSVCIGEVLDLDRPKSLGTATADAGGTATLNVNLDSSFSGKTLHVQARVQTEVCDITNKVVQDIP